MKLSTAKIVLLVVVLIMVANTPMVESGEVSSCNVYCLSRSSNDNGVKSCCKNRGFKKGKCKDRRADCSDKK